MQNIDDLRTQIDKLDDRILECLNQRMSYVKKIGELKKSSGANIYRPEREKAILSRLYNQNEGPLNKEAIEAIYFEIFGVSRNLEMPQRVAFLGPDGTYSHQAAESRFGAMSSYTPLATIDAVFREIINKEAKYGVVPVENNTEGAVGLTLDCLGIFEDIKIVSELYMDIHHSFVSLNENIKKINKIYSHPQAYNQCLKFLESHNLGDVEFIATKSTAMAAKMALNDENSAAICSKIAAKIYNVPAIFETIEDNNANKTRFLILSDFKALRGEHNKTSILVNADHRPGGLVDLLSIFRNEGINLTKLESRPMKNKDFKTVFFIDFEGYIDDDRVMSAFELAAKRGHDIKWLGSYINGEIQ